MYCLLYKHFKNKKNMKHKWEFNIKEIKCTVKKWKFNKQQQKQKNRKNIHSTISSC